DDFYFSDRHNVRSSDYLVVNVSSTLHFDAFDLSIWGRNLTDETIYTRGFGSFGNDPRKDYATEPYFQFGEPRVWGMTLTAQLAGQ
ncbi:MAG: TonB-dependent receptor, partial [Pseudomonadota bacterium]|nr:TonB-dependent receptor [Pseudomonadota bacterium]